jgi:hypothetical protein
MYPALHAAVVGAAESRPFFLSAFLNIGREKREYSSVWQVRIGIVENTPELAEHAGDVLEVDGGG